MKRSPILKRIQKLIRGRASGLWRLLLLSAVVGAVAGLGAIAFYVMLDAAKYFFMDMLAGYHVPGPGGESSMFPALETPLRRGVLFLVPIIGGLLSGALVYWLAPEAEGHGTDAAIAAYHYHGGSVRARVPFVKAIASALTIGSGGSGGREGPIAQIGSGFGSTIARWFGLSARERRHLMAVGMAAGIGAMFQAPLAGALFAAEVLYRDLDFEYEVIVPSVIASVIAHAVFVMHFGKEPLFVTPPFVFAKPIQLAGYLVLALAVAAGAILYVRTFYGVRNVFAKMRIPLFLKPAVGGLLVGAIGLLLPEAMGTGDHMLQRALASGTSIEARFGAISGLLLLAVALGKILTTAFAIGSGGSGGVFGPALVIGGSMGGAVGIGLADLFPAMQIEPGAFVIVGMAGFFAAAANTPVSTILMVSEMTGNYNLLVPSMWVCIIAYLLARKHQIYEKQLPNRFDAPVHYGSMVDSVLRALTVQDALAVFGNPVHSLPADMPLAEVVRQFARSHQSSFPVVNSSGEMIGMVRGKDLRLAASLGGDLHRSVVAWDLTSTPVTVRRNDSLKTAVERMGAAEVDEIVVVDGPSPIRPAAVLRHHDILAAYHRLVTSEAVRDRR